MTDKTIDHVALTVRDLPVMADFYANALGLTRLGGDGATERLGAGNHTLLELRHDRAATPRDPRQAGLFHTAFLLPTRTDLAEWLQHAADTGVRLTGASDHGVSEALYLDDPEGNGIEIYWDRPDDQWTRNGDRIEMFTRRLDLNELLSQTRTPFVTAAAGTTIGHVHMQVGDLARADKFFQGDLALTQTFDAPGGAWYGWNGYHHQFAGNIWNSRGAGPRATGQTGLAEVVIRDMARAGTQTTDPWGTHFRFV